jgi:hypothetical protein
MDSRKVQMAVTSVHATMLQNYQLIAVSDQCARCIVNMDSRKGQMAVTPVYATMSQN